MKRLYFIFIMIPINAINEQRPRTDSDVNKMWQIVRDKVFEGNNSLLVDQLEDRIKQRISESPKPSPHRESIPRSISYDNLDDALQEERNYRFLTRLVNDVVEEHLKEKIALEEMQEKRSKIAEKRFKIALACNIATALLAAGVTLAATFGTC